MNEEDREVEKAYKYSLRYLGFRQRTRKEMNEYLIKKGFSSQVIENVLERLTSCGYLDDRQFAREWIISRAKRGNGSTKLMQELFYKGVDKRIIEEQLRECLCEEDEVYYAGILLEKKINKSGQYSEKDTKNSRMKQKNKLAFYLKSRGYSDVIVNKVLNEYFNHDL